MISEKIKAIANHYGLSHQEVKIMEELAELQKAIARDILNKTGEDIQNKRISGDVIEEIADVRIMLEQIEYLSGCGRQVEIYMEQKLKRQLDRIEIELSKER